MSCRVCSMYVLQQQSLCISPWKIKYAMKVHCIPVLYDVSYTRRRNYSSLCSNSFREDLQSN